MTREDILSRVRLTNLGLSRSSSNYLGRYKSHFKGSGLELDSLREYVQGDSVKNIDWKATSKGDRVFVKQYVEERNSELFFLLDLSKSMLEQDKILTSLTIFGSLALSAQKMGDRVGVAFFSDKIDKSFRYSSTKANIYKIIDEALDFKSGIKTDIKKVLRDSKRFLKRSTVLILISDFLDDGYFEELNRMQKMHKVVVAKISDESNKIPKGYMFRVRDRESSQFGYVTSTETDSDGLSLNNLTDFLMRFRVR